MIEQATRWVTYVFENGCFMDETTDIPQWLPELGDWTAPFPNEGGNSTAFGLRESFWQSDFVPAHESWGDMVRVIVSQEKPELVLKF